MELSSPEDKKKLEFFYKQKLEDNSIKIDEVKRSFERCDIPLLIQHFSKKISEEQGTICKEFSKNAITMLQKYDWTGNIRELRNVIERLIILSGEQVSENDVKLFASK